MIVDLIHDVVGYGGLDIYARLHGHILDLSLVLFWVRVSLIMTPFGYLADSVVDRTTLTFLDSGSVQIVMQRVVGQCDAIATGAERPVPEHSCCSLLSWNTGKSGGRSKGPLG